MPPPPPTSPRMPRPRKEPPMPRPRTIPKLAVLSLLLVSAAACEKDVHEVRRTQPGPVAIGGNQRFPSIGAPAGTTGNVVAPGPTGRDPKSGAPLAPSG